MKLGILSDTHNLLRPQVLSALRGVDVILHAGDVSRPDILRQSEDIAPVHAVRGNNDRNWAEPLPMNRDFVLGGVHIYMTHRKQDLPGDFVLIENQTELRDMKALSMWQSSHTERHPFSAIPQNETASFMNGRKIS